MPSYSQRPLDASSFRLVNDYWLHHYSLALSDLVHSQAFEKVCDEFDDHFANQMEAVLTHRTPGQTNP